MKATWIAWAGAIGLAARALAGGWSVGQPDGKDREFALAPRDFGAFREDPTFLVGVSDPAKDWPYVHPGPEDAWAGSKAHTFTIVFGLAAAPSGGTARLRVRLADTHGVKPPQFEIAVNGQSSTHDLPPGGGDASVHGDLAAAKPREIVVDMPADRLRAGANEIRITNRRGSWALYDAVSMELPGEATAAALPAYTRLVAVSTPMALVEREGKLFHPIAAEILHAGPAREATLAAGGPAQPVRLAPGRQTAELLAPAVTAAAPVTVRLEIPGEAAQTAALTLQPVRKWTVYVLMHSHVDIGYTDIQPNIARKQAQNVARALELIRETREYPAGARFKWNLEVFWPVEQFLKTATAEQVRALEAAVREGGIGVDAMLSHLLTGAARSEELLRQLGFATDFGRRCGVAVDSMMITDVPGLTWGLVPALAQAGVKYISAGPNEGDRIGYTRLAWENKPFYWVSPSGREQVLYWGSQGGYSWGHHYPSLTAALPPLLRRMAEVGYPYDLVQLRWSKGDNGPADEGVMPAVRDWNAKYAWPKLIIATTGEAFREFERRYNADLPRARGDFTPYWEDGLGSSARETGLNRHSSDRLAQAETLWALFDPTSYPADAFREAWKNTAMYSEHTWGAHNSIREPDSEFVKTQWAYKRAYAVDADRQSRELLAKALALRGAAAEPVAAVDVFNTASWPRTDLVTLPKDLKLPGDAVRDDRGQPTPSQRLGSGELVFLARDVPPLGGRRFAVAAGAPAAAGEARADGLSLRTPEFEVRVDPASGAIASLKRTGVDGDLVDPKAAVAVNEYVYLPGGDVKNAQRNGPARVSVKEAGPLVASLLIESDAPGCNSLRREVRVIDGVDRVEMLNLVDKKAVRAVEGVHFGFGFRVPDPEVRVNSPGAIARVEKDQIAGACKNWYSVERWVDISNDRGGVTWATMDAPLVEVGGLTANLPRGQPDPNAYLKTIKPSAEIYAWVMNNHWHTNYRADQEGPTWFRFAVRPHRGYDPVAASRFGVEATQPLLAAPAAGPAPGPARIAVEAGDAMVAACKPADDGRGLVLRLYNPTARAVAARVPPNAVRSALDEQPREAVPNSKLELAPAELQTVRVGAPST